MSYIPLLLAISVFPMLTGYAVTKRRTKNTAVKELPVVLTIALLVAAWFFLSWFTRKYSESDNACWALAEWWAHSGKWYVFAVFMLFFMGVTVALEKPGISRRRAVLCACAVLMVIWTTVWRTIPVYAFLPRTVSRDDSGYIIQSVPYTCGPVSLANFMERYLGFKNVTEREMARLSHTTYEGTTMSGLVRAARKSGLRVVECRTMTMEELEAAGRPAIVFFSTIPEVHHATLFVDAREGNVHFIDPACGAWKTTRKRFLTIWYGKTLILRAEG